MTLPIPSPEAQQLSAQLISVIKDEIAQNGVMSFERYMSLALYAPGLGYYRNALHKFGESGDFVTAPEISSLFSQSLANQCAQVLSEIGGDILEFGAGRGVMAADILLHLEKLNQLPAHYYILEVSAQLQNVQKEMIGQKAPQLLDRVIWLESLPKTPITGVVLANEVLDAMPVTLFSWMDSQPKQCGITLHDDSLIMCLMDADTDLISSMSALEADFAEGYTSEINKHLFPWINSIAQSLGQGVVLLIDYGFPRREYYHPDRDQGTLMCHYRHYAHTNPLVYPGLQDITAHVDFTAVAEAGDAAGLTVAGYINQAGFLLNCGLLSLIDTKAAEEIRFAQNQAVLRLTMPSEMGELFKVIALTKSFENTLMGFEKMNQLERLG